MNWQDILSVYESSPTMISKSITNVHIRRTYCHNTAFLSILPPFVIQGQMFINNTQIPRNTSFHGPVSNTSLPWPICSLLTLFFVFEITGLREKMTSWRISWSPSPWIHCDANCVRVDFVSNQSRNYLEKTKGLNIILELNLMLDVPLVLSEKSK